MAKCKNAWGDQELVAAMEKVKSKELSLRQAAITFGIPKSTLSDHVTGRSSKRYGGAPTVLSDIEEAEIVITCQTLAEMGFPLNKDYVDVVVKGYLKQIGRPNPFGEDGIPGYSWWKGFLIRHPQLSKRRPQHLSKKRAESNDPDMLDKWFEKLADLYETSNLTDYDAAERIWNCDETGFCTAVATKSVLAKRGSKNVHKTGGGSGREYITVLGIITMYYIIIIIGIILLIGCGSASGKRLPPYIVYKAKHMYDIWKNGGPPGTLYSVSPSGWMESANFLSWFNKLFLQNVEHLTKEGPVFLFVDGHYSHLSLDLIYTARENGVHLVCFPPNLTHILQPLDVSVYHPLKQAYSAILKEHKLETMAENVTKAVFPSLMNKLWYKSFKPSHLQSGFRTTGLYPLNRWAISYSKTSTGIPFQQTDDGLSSSTTLSSDPDLAFPRLLRGNCKHCGEELTPMRPHLTSHFSKLLQKKNEQHTKKKKRVNTEYGEALTSEEVIARLESQVMAKASKTNSKQKKQPEDQSVNNEASDHDEGKLSANY